MGVWVPITGVYNQFLGASGPIKKKTVKFCRFQIWFFCQKCAKMRKKNIFAFLVHNHFLIPILTPNFSSFGLQLAEKIQKIHSLAKKKSLLKKKVFVTFWHIFGKKTKFENGPFFFLNGSGGT